MINVDGSCTWRTSGCVVGGVCATEFSSRYVEFELHRNMVWGLVKAKKMVISFQTSEDDTDFFH